MVQHVLFKPVALDGERLAVRERFLKTFFSCLKAIHFDSMAAILGTVVHKQYISTKYWTNQSLFQIQDTKKERKKKKNLKIAAHSTCSTLYHGQTTFTVHRNFPKCASKLQQCVLFLFSRIVSTVVNNICSQLQWEKLLMMSLDYPQPIGSVVFTTQLAHRRGQLNTLLAQSHQSVTMRTSRTLQQITRSTQSADIGLLMMRRTCATDSIKSYKSIQAVSGSPQEWFSDGKFVAIHHLYVERLAKSAKAPMP